MIIPADFTEERWEQSSPLRHRTGGTTVLYARVLFYYPNIFHPSHDLVKLYLIRKKESMPSSKQDSIHNEPRIILNNHSHRYHTDKTPEAPIQCTKLCRVSVARLENNMPSRSKKTRDCVSSRYVAHDACDALSHNEACR